MICSNSTPDWSATEAAQSRSHSGCLNVGVMIEKTIFASLNATVKSNNLRTQYRILRFKVFHRSRLPIARLAGQPSIQSLAAAGVEKRLFAQPPIEGIRH